MRKLGLILICVCGAGIFLAVQSLRPEPGVWRPLKEFRDQGGVHYLVAAEHYDWFEGWAVNFFIVRSNTQIQALNLEIETGPWTGVLLQKSNDMVSISHDGKLYAVYSARDQTLSNCAFGNITTNAMPGIPLRPASNSWGYVFEYDHNPNSRIEPVPATGR